MQSNTTQIYQQPTMALWQYYPVSYTDYKSRGSESDRAYRVFGALLHENVQFHLGTQD